MCHVVDLSSQSIQTETHLTQILGWWSKQGLSDIKDFLQLDVVVPVPEQKYKKMDHIIKRSKSIIHLPAYV